MRLNSVVLQQEDDGKKGKSNWSFQNLVCKNYATLDTDTRMKYISVNVDIEDISSWAVKSEVKQ